jgi:hypothetical protein
MATVLSFPITWIHTMIIELLSANNENKRRNDSYTIQENVLLTKVEQIEHPPPSSLSLTNNKVLQQKMKI